MTLDLENIIVIAECFPLPGEEKPFGDIAAKNFKVGDIVEWRTWSSHQEEWESHDRSFVALAGIQWKIFMDALDASKKFLPEGSLLDLSYEDLCSDPNGVFQKVIKFCGLQESMSFSRSLENFSLVDTGSKWRRHLTASQQKTLNEVLSGYLEKHGYSDDGD